MDKSYQEEWDEFLERCNGRNNFVNFINELYELDRTNSVAHKELGRIASAYKPKDGTTVPSLWEEGSMFLMQRVPKSDRE